MSNTVSVFVKRRVIGSPTLKGVLLYMADNASDDGTGIWTSKGNIARDLELSKRAVQIAIQNLMEFGIVLEDGTRKCVNGFTMEYSICLDTLNRLPSTRENLSKGTGEPHSPVNHIHGYGRTTFTGTGEPHSPKPSLEPSLEPSKERDGLFDAMETPEAKKSGDGFDEFWNAYPKKAGKPAAQKAYQKAIKNGAAPDAIITGAKRYALWLSTGGPKDFRPTVKFPQGWLNDERWNDADLPALPPEKPKFAVGSPEDLAERRKRLSPQFGEVVR